MLSASQNNLNIKVTPTPWDTRALGFSTFNISLPEPSTENETEIVASLINVTKASEKSIFYCRTNAHSVVNKRILTSAGFYNCETQLQIHRGGLKNFLAPKEIGTKRLSIANATEQDYLEVSSEALRVFKYSRFHEDPFICSDDADARMRAWCLDMHQQKTPLLVARNKAGQLDAFLFYSEAKSQHLELILGGSVPGKGMLTPLFWASFLEYFKESHINSVSTKISASNLVILNIYFLFGFSVTGTYFDYHKLVDPRDPIQ